MLMLDAFIPGRALSAEAETTVMPTTKAPPFPCQHLTVETSLRDGRTVDLRPLRRGEHAPVQRVFAGLSPRSRYLRFLAPLPQLPAPMLHTLTDVDHRGHSAWVALHDKDPVGLARAVRTRKDPSAAEIAVAVVDREHRCGIASALLRVLAVATADVGITTWRWTATLDNMPVRQLTHALAVDHTARIDGLIEGRTVLPAPRSVNCALVRYLAAAAADDAPTICSGEYFFSRSD